MLPPLVHQLVERRATELPSHVAVSHGGESLTHATLNARANRLAHVLVARGAGPDSVIGVCLPRSVELVVSILGVLKAGAAWLPLEPSTPPERLRYLVASAGVTAVIGTGPAVERLSREDIPVLAPRGLELESYPDVNPGVRVLPDHLAYVIYTSGSTGLPKGVMVSHRALSAFTAYHCGTFALSPADRVGVIASLGFDAAVMSILPSLAAGARLELPDDEETRLSPRKLQQWLLARDITFVFLPTPLAERVLPLSWSQACALRLLLTGGDRLHVRPRPGLPFQLVNGYGPAEATIYCTSGFVPPGGEALPSIGHPIDGAEVHLLGPELRPVDPGETGELYLGGPGLARGYVGAPDLTAERFIPNPFSRTDGERLYRTGDLGRWLPDGSLEFLGRTDRQVKVRGIRIEPGEIAAALLRHPHVGAAHVMPRSTGEDVSFVAWFAPKDPRAVPGTEQLREHLRAWLPEAMMPRTFIVVDALPLGPTGKVDPQALPLPAVHVPRSTAYVAPRTELERELVRVWQEVLRLEPIGIQDDFFELGGHSLLATQLTTRVEDALRIPLSMRELFAHPRIRQLAELLEAKRAAPVKDVLPPVVRAGLQRAPLTVQQEQVWFLQKLSPGSISYQAQTTLRVLGGLDLSVLERALTEISRRHELLRTTYEEVDGRPWQVVQPVTPVRVPLLDLSGLPADERERLREEAIRQELRRPLSLFEPPLVRWSAIRLAPDEHELVLVEHHVVHDGASFAVLMRELDALYNAFQRGEASPLPELPVQYSDFAAWQRAALDAPAMQAQLAFWRERLAGAPEVLPLRTDRPRPRVQSFNGDLLRLELPPALPGALRTFCQQEGVTLFNALFAAFATLLHRYTGEEDLCIGSAFAARAGIRNVESLIGMFVNAVVLRCDVSGAPSFRALVRQVRDVTAAAAEHQTYPFLKLVEALGVKRDPSRNPLVQAMFSFHDSAVPGHRLGAAACTVFERGNGSSKVDLDVVAIPHAGRHLGDPERGDGRISLIWEYNRDLFDRETMERMSTHFLRLLEAAVAGPDTPVSRLPMLGDAERRTLLVEWNVHSAVLRSEAPVHHQVLEQALRTPGAVAVRDEAGTLTYAELVRRATLLAEHLCQQGAGMESIVGVCVPRGADLVTAELGVLLAGAAFLPLDPEHPAERLGLILADAGVRQVVTTAALSGRLPATLERVCVEGFHAPGTPRGRLSADVRPGQLAYVMYTSGSTGRPKGVMVEHQSLAWLAGWHRRAFGLDETSRTTLLYSPAFDPSAAELWPALAAGASLHVPGQDVRLSPERLQAWLLSERITFTDLPTALAERLLALPWPAACELRTVLAGGDRLHSRPGARLPWRLFNQYGPTETTVTATSGEVLPAGPDEALPSIGRPIDGATAYVLDVRLQPVPPGVAGELYLGGTGVARGYLHRPDLTAERFISDPFSPRPGARLYRTGDLVRYRPDGSLEFLGRVDAQVKVRGFRVEPGEVSALLRTCPGIAEAHVRAWSAPGGVPRLAGYLVPRAGEALPPPARLREHLSRVLPAYMIPSAWVELKALPLTHSGKVDVRALPEPAPVAPALQAPLASELERQLAGLWCETLRLERVGAEDNFFDLGGHSLLLAQVQHLLKSRLGHEVPMVKLFEFPTIRALAGHLQGQGDGGEAAAAQQQRQEQLRSGRTRLLGRRERLAVDSSREEAE